MDTFEMIKLDVSHLAAPEPMTKIIQALSRLTKQQFLQIRHRREPFPLYEKLADTGWLFLCHQPSTDLFVIYLYKEEQHQFVNHLPLIENKN